MPFIGLSRPARASGSLLAARPEAGQLAPDTPALASPRAIKLLAFLRHVGCPFAEHTVKRLRAWALDHPEVDVIVVSHGDRTVTDAWIATIGGLGSMRLVHDPQRALYAHWGLGEARLMHFAGLPSLFGVVRLWAQGIRNRDATGTRWQRAGLFLVEGQQVVWSHLPLSAEAFALPPPIRPARRPHQ
jgi:hypothetical protein